MAKITGIIKDKLRSLTPRFLLKIYHFLTAVFFVAFYRYPARSLFVIGVTGTDGKTTTTNLIYSIIKATGKKVGLITTLGARIEDKEYETGLHITSPHPKDVQRFLRLMVQQRTEYAVLEVTSHGLDQFRFLGSNFKIGVVTNVTSEHLDYHRTFEEYLYTKSKLVKSVPMPVLNSDDASYSYLSRIVSGTRVTFGRSPNADFWAEEISSDWTGVKFLLHAPDLKEHMVISSPLLGSYNVENILAAVAVGHWLGIGYLKIQEGISTIKSLAGRMEQVKKGQNFQVLIDFAHTPNGLRKALTFVKKQVEARRQGRIIAVFGCAGERDKVKRPKMGKVAAAVADLIILTAEDPRREDVDDIIEQIAQGCQEKGAIEINVEKIEDLGNQFPVFFRLPDRKKAIKFAIRNLAQKDDVVIICGKGHEKSMCFDTTEYPWSDRKEAEEALSE